LTRQIETYIREQIRDGQLRPGDVLPRQIDLARQFGVSQQLVHRAVRRLRDQGVVETKRYARRRASVPEGVQLEIGWANAGTPTDTGS